METRKIQLAGGTTYTVSLPKQWASEHDLEAGATVRVEPHADGSLVVRTNGHHAARNQLTLAADGVAPEAIRRRVRAAYRTGRDGVALTSDAAFEADQRAAVRSASQDLLGVDVVAESDDRIVCKSLLDTADVSVEQSLHQLQFVALSALSDAVAALTGDHDDPRSVDDREEEAARLAALVARQFERVLVDPGELDDLAVTRSTLLDYDVAARELERVAAHATTIADVARCRDEPFPDDVGTAIDSSATDVRDLVRRTTNAVLDGVGPEDACDLVADADVLTGPTLDWVTADRALSPESAAEFTVVSHALAAAADCGGTIADVALRTAVRADGR